MALASASAEAIHLAQTDVSPSDLASDSSSSSPQTPDRSDLSNSSPAPSSRDSESQSLSSLRSEEYRRLFRLPINDVLLQDFNCAYQENILLQGHMYVFGHHICFYSNIFGFETKKVIPFLEITSVKRAKTAGIFPNAIEILAGDKKYFFASFLSRDEALKVINDGCLQHGNGSKAIGEQQESVSGSHGYGDGAVKIETEGSYKNDNELQSDSRVPDDACPSDSGPSSCIEDDTVSINTQLEEIGAEVHVDQDIGRIEMDESSSSIRSSSWTEESCDAPEISTLYTKVSETKFPMKVQQFFNLFFSNDSIGFAESFHTRCGDKDFRCSTWKPHENFGNIRDVAFQHPIKVYFGARFGSCREVQKFRVFKNGHLVIETSQEINDVPYGDYFRVEGRWDVVKDGFGSSEGCILKVYVGVAFSKKTVFKGKIVQSTLDECREAYGIWIEMAHEFLKQKSLEKPEAVEVHPGGSSANPDACSEAVKAEVAPSSNYLAPQMARSSSVRQSVDSLVQQNIMNGSSIESLVGGYTARFCSFLKGQSQISIVLAVAFVVIFLMQVSIVVLLNRPQHVVVAPGGFSMEMGQERSSETVAWLERRMIHLKDEMLMVGAQLDRLRHEHDWLKQQMEEFANVPKS